MRLYCTKTCCSWSKMIHLLLVAVLVLILDPALGARVPRRQATSLFSYNNLLGLQEQVISWTKAVVGESAFRPLLSRLRKRQQPVSREVSFPCSTAGARSPSPPVSVHRLRPGDIDVVAALGDSLTAGTVRHVADTWGRTGDLSEVAWGDAALEDSALGIFIQYRGVSWSIGGQADWRTYLTLPNILRQFNPNVTGYSLGEGSFQAKNSRFNIAMPAALDDDTYKQARILVARIRADKTIDFVNSWKLVTIFIGHNDLCSKACFEPERHTAAHHAMQLRRAIDFLQRNLPRTFVNLITVADVTFSLRLQRSMMCRMLHPLLCACLHRGRASSPAQWIANLSRQYVQAERDLVSSGRYDDDPQFTVELQTFSEFTHRLGLMAGPALGEQVTHLKGAWLSDEQLIGPDCFHMSQAGSAILANMAWNNFLQPVGNKSSQPLQRLWEKFICPSERAPYLFTRKNSENFHRFGTQLLSTEY